MTSSLSVVWNLFIIISIIAVFPVRSASAPGSAFDLSHYQLQLPTGKPGSPDMVTGSSLSKYSSQYFSLNSDGSIKFWCPVNGVHTSGSNFPRTELRDTQVVSGGDGKGNWGFKGFHQLNVTMKVTQVPGSKTITIGQIHGESMNGKTVAGSCSIVIEFEWNNGKLVNHYRGSPSGTTCDAKSTTLPGTYALGEKFSYSLLVADTNIQVWTSKGGWSAPYSYSWFAGTGKYWMYFKVGDYVQDTGSSSTQGGELSVYSFKTYHSTTVPKLAAASKAESDEALADLAVADSSSNAQGPSGTDTALLGVVIGVGVVVLIAVIIVIALLAKINARQQVESV